ncbi:MAG: ribulose-phosphate 3-epimerase [Clostridia bacterium]|jgi:ribulose-phosphate 3-epimerase|nr:ribulose-phosphate 3-epimerase [Clostridia bacterium]
MKDTILISPSLLAADFSRLAEEIAGIESAADYLHLDVMDGHFVPNMSIGPAVISSLRSVSDLIFDVHLMISDPGKYADAFIDAGADIITFHIEACPDPRPVIEKIRGRGRHAGLAISPDTPAEAVFPYLGEVGMILVMTVYPGFGGQKLIKDTIPKITQIRREAEARGLDTDIEVDGGIGDGNVALLSAAGANVIVAGSSVFRSHDPEDAVGRLREAAESAPYVHY